MSKSAKQGSLLVALLPSVILYVGAIVLLALTRESLGGTVHYWEIFVAVVAVISLLSGWGQTYAANRSYLMYLIKQFIHWGLLIGVLWMFQTQGISSALGDQKYTLVLLYLLSMSAIVAGLYIDFKALFFGAFMAICTYLLAAPANVSILEPIGKTLRIADPQTKPLTMIIVMGVIAFVAGALVLISVRGSIMAKRSRA
ncbi:hypothetical protein [Thiocystis violascens]|uniref:Uncharacterized protein n=1 Tax=Thiocystis violascens (strain ATCC 17096 / DSM 198 / 6111) TaxID=765911 RepID=I3YA26_THIV6|nr:hypothetical protein [Thiocystis violascens]AFL73844.1 hypothetical protein Thivi_1875 [Thiocystis violascens DSM 198]